MQAIDDGCGAFGMPRGLRQDNRPKPILSKEELALQKKAKESHKIEYNSFIQERIRKAQKNTPATNITRLVTSETQKLIGSMTSSKKKNDSDEELDFVGGSKKLSIKEQLEKGKLTFAEKFGSAIPKTSSV